MEAVENCLGDVLKGKRGQRALGKIDMLGFLKRVGRVYTAIILNTKMETGDAFTCHEEDSA